MSTDEKPTNCDVNSLFYELDTGDFYYFDGVWKKVGSKVQLQDTGNSGTIEITENDVYNVTDYDYADVNVPGVIPVGTLPILENGTADVTSYATAEVDVDYVTVNFNLPAFKKTTPTKLSQARNYLAAATVGDYALFGGGYNGSSYFSVVDAYNANLTRTTPTELSQARSSLAATTVGDYALFGGGSSSSVVDAYDTSLMRTTPTELSQARNSLAATAVGDYALFGGGFSNIVGYSPVVDAYDTTLTRTTPTDQLSTGRYHLAATTVAPVGGSSPQSGYALFGGGYGSNVVDAYDINLTRTTPTDPLGGSNLGQLAATTVAPVGGSSPQSGYALFGGGVGSYNGAVYAYDTNLTRLTADPLGRPSYEIAATTVGNYALFGGGTTTRTVYAYDASLTKSTINDQLSVYRRSPAATTIGNYALFGGGYNGSSSYYNSVDAYNPFHDIQVLPETKYNFNNSVEIFSDTMQTINIQGPVVGYMKIKNVNVN